VSHEETNHTHPPATATTAPGEIFSAAERVALVEEDKSAARGLAFLMNGVFIVGVLLYSYVALSIWR